MKTGRDNERLGFDLRENGFQSLVRLTGIERDEDAACSQHRDDRGYEACVLFENHYNRGTFLRSGIDQPGGQFV